MLVILSLPFLLWYLVLKPMSQNRQIASIFNLVDLENPNPPPNNNLSLILTGLKAHHGRRAYSPNISSNFFSISSSFTFGLEISILGFLMTLVILGIF